MSLLLQDLGPWVVGSSATVQRKNTKMQASEITSLLLTPYLPELNRDAKLQKRLEAASGR